MPHAHRTGRVFLAMMGLVGAAVAVGCMRSSNLRTSAASLPELAPAGELHPAAVEAAVATTTAAPGSASTSWSRPPVATPTRPPVDAGLAPAATAGNSARPGPSTSRPPEGIDPVDAPAPGGPPPGSPAPAGDRPAPPQTAPTPLLDAEIRRAEAVTRQHIESQQGIDPPPPAAPPVVARPDRPAATPGPSSAEPRPDAAELEVIAPLPLSAQVMVEPEVAASPAPVAIPPLIPIDPPSAGSAPPAAEAPPRTPAPDDPAPSGLPTAPVAEAPRGEATSGGPTSPRSESSAPERPEDNTRPTAGAGDASATGGPSPQPEHPPLEIAALRVCSRVRGFGSFDPMDVESLRPGRRALVYCELGGLDYQARGDSFVSRVSAHLELRSGTDGSVLWEQSPGIAEDLCHRPRRDYFVTYKVEFPPSLAPGPYRLRLIQTDLVGNRVACREVPVRFAP